MVLVAADRTAPGRLFHACKVEERKDSAYVLVFA